MAESIAAAGTYSLQLLRKRPGTPFLRSLNDRGELVGNSSTPAKPTCWDSAGKLRWRRADLVGSCRRINSSGIAAGNRVEDQQSIAVLYDEEGRSSDLSPELGFAPGLSEALSINNRGDVIGIAAPRRVRTVTGFVALSGESKTRLLGEHMRPVAINDSRLVVGSVGATASQTRQSGFVWSPAMERPRIIEAETDLTLLALNNRGQIAGWKEIKGKPAPGDVPSQACIFDSEGNPVFCWEHDTDSVSMFLDINSAGWAAGTIRTGGNSTAVLFDGDRVLDLNTLIKDRPEDLFLEVACAISDGGVIVGTARRDGCSEQFICLPS